MAAPIVIAGTDLARSTTASSLASTDNISRTTPNTVSDLSLYSVSDPLEPEVQNAVFSPGLFLGKPLSAESFDSHTLVGGDPRDDGADLEVTPVPPAPQGQERDADRHAEPAERAAPVEQAAPAEQSGPGVQALSDGQTSSSGDAAPMPEADGQEGEAGGAE